MLMNKFSFNATVENDEARELIVSGLTSLTKASLAKNTEYGIFVKKYSVGDFDYEGYNATVKEKIVKYCAEKAGIADVVDVSTRKGLVKAFGNSDFEWNFFAIQTEVLGTLMADVEVEQAMGFVNLTNVGFGDSKTFYVGSKALYDVEEASYGNRVTRPRKQFKQPITIVPSAKEASVQFDVVQMLTANYDFGAEMAKIIVSIRAKQYQDAIDILFDSTPLAGTPFYKAAFNLANYTTLAEVVGAVNGTGITAYGTRSAFRTASATVTTGFATLDEINKQSFISDLYGVPTRILEQAVDTGSASFSFRVPNDAVVVMSNTGEKPIKIVQEDYFDVKLQDGNSGNIATKVYKYIFSYGIGLATSAPYGYQTI